MRPFLLSATRNEPASISLPTESSAAKATLARDPFCRRILCNVDPDQLSPVQPNNDEGIEQVEANGRDNE